MITTEMVLIAHVHIRAGINHLHTTRVSWAKDGMSVKHQLTHNFGLLLHFYLLFIPLALLDIELSTVAHNTLLDKWSVHNEVVDRCMLWGLQEAHIER